MDLDGIGYARHLQAERAAIMANVAPRHRAKLRGWAPPPVEAKTHRITVNLKTGERTVANVKPRRKKKRKAPKPAEAAIYVARGLPRIPRQEAIKVIVAVGAEWDITYYALTSACRTDRTARPRFACFLLLTERLRFSLPRVGRLMGNRDHTTVIHGLRRARHLMDHDPDWRRRYDAVVAKLEKGGEP